MDKPIIVTRISGNIIQYDLGEIDGQLSMLNRSFSGCAIAMFSKRMDENVYGKITIEGKELKKGFFSIYQNMNLQLLGFPVRGVVNEYEKSYTALVEGFADIDGNMMDPQEITIRTLPKKNPVPGYEEHEKVALEAAREGILLLKNDERVLPLKKDGTLNVFGKGLLQFRTGGLGAGKINPRYNVNFMRAVEECSEFSFNSELTELYMSDLDVCPSEEVLERAYDQSDTAIIMISRASGENIDNRPIPGEYYLSVEEEEMIQAVSRKFDKIIAIVNSGYPIDVRWVEQYHIKGLVICGFVGMLGGQALVEILDGRVNPSAKLPDTWSLDYYDIPASRNFYNAVEGIPVMDTDAPYYADTYYEEDIYVGYRYFETFGQKVAYPFGYGLSYTTYSVKPTRFTFESNKVRLSVEVVNTGSVTGKEVVQVYVEEPDGLLEKPARKLVGFAKTESLEPGDKQVLEFEIKEDQLASYDTESASWIMEKGTYTFFAGASIKQLEQAGSLMLEETRTIRIVSNRMSPPVSIRTLSKRDPIRTFPTGEHSGIKPGITELTP
jgi:beta-glucosidase